MCEFVCEVSRSASEYDGQIKEKQAQHGVSGIIFVQLSTANHVLLNVFP